MGAHFKPLGTALGCLLLLARVDKRLCDPLKEERRYLKDTAHLGGKCLSITGTQARSEC